MNTQNKKMSTQTLALGAILTAMVILLQMVGAFIHFGMFSVTLVLVPIVIGAILCGPVIGAWLGLVFGVVVLFTDAAAFMAISPAGTIFIVLLKGTLCGLAAGLVYKLIRKLNDIVAAVAAALICPFVNTGIFLLGCQLFFMNDIAQWAAANNFGDNLWGFMVFGLGLINFPFELLFNLVLSPVIVRLLKISKKIA